MGGGASLMEGGMEELLTTTILIGRAISAVTFPGMYRLYDFHSNKAPKLRNQRQFPTPFSPFYAPDSDEENEEDSSAAESQHVSDPAVYGRFFKVSVGEDDIYLEDPLLENDAGWTPLHACCMSLSTVEAGLAIIEETIRRGGSLDIKTQYGPGTFNKGWTALQMACAYGIEPLVDKLVQSGANVNACNSFGYSCMLEACHRGYIVVARSLLKSPQMDLSYIPREEESLNSPFASAPNQSALAEAARCGFFKVVQMLLDAGAPKDLSNRLGWTALHEACFYNRMETVKTLLLSGANPTLRSRQGALPYHLACIPEIRSMLESMGGEGAVPNEHDVVDMLQILTELTMPSDVYEEYTRINKSNNTVLDDPISRRLDDRSSEERSIPKTTIVVIEGKGSPGDDHYDEKSSPGDRSNNNNNNNNRRVAASKPRKVSFNEDEVLGHEASQEHNSVLSNENIGGVIKKKGGISVEEPEGGRLIHSGPMLGNLPALNSNKLSPTKNFQSEVDSVLTESNKSIAAAAAARDPNSLFGSTSIAGRAKNPSRKADDKLRKRKDNRHDNDVPADIPEEYLCQLTRRPLSDPMKTIYGHVFDKTAITNWLHSQGKICPLTGAPLSEVDLIPQPQLADDIRRWILKRSIDKNDTSSSTSSSGSPSSVHPAPMDPSPISSSIITNTTIGGARGGGGAKGVGSRPGSGTDDDDDLYDF